MKSSMMSQLVERFDRMTLRERALVFVAILVGMFMLWDALLMSPLMTEKSRLLRQLTETTDAINATAVSMEAGAALDPVNAALARKKELQGKLEKVDAELAASAEGFIPPELMVQVVRDVLARQQGLKLISLQNGAVHSLVPPPDDKTPEVAPYIHPVDLVIEGSYLEVLAYLRALESLQWRFYWKTLELNTVEYPTNRVHIELSTLSMDRDWLGV